MLPALSVCLLAYKVRNTRTHLWRDIDVRARGHLLAADLEQCLAEADDVLALPEGHTLGGFLDLFQVV